MCFGKFLLSSLFYLAFISNTLSQTTDISLSYFSYPKPNDSIPIHHQDSLVVVIKNLGNDTIPIGDSLVAAFALNSQFISGLYIHYFSEGFNPGDSLNINSNVFVWEQQNTDTGWNELCGIVSYAADNNSSNNQLCQELYLKPVVNNINTYTNKNWNDKSLIFSYSAPFYSVNLTSKTNQQYQACLLNTNGQILKTLAFKNTTSLDVSALSNGLYWLMVVDEGGKKQTFGWYR